MTDIQMTKEELQSALDMMGVKYHHNAKLDTLQQLFDDAKGKKEEVAVNPKVDPRAHLILKRYKISCMNPVKRDWTGEIFTAGNDTVGTVRKFIPYNCAAAESWHIPAIIVESMKDRKYIEISMKKDRKGHDYVEKFWKPEFVLTELPPLTQEQMQQLAQHQKLVNASQAGEDQY